MLPGSCLGTAIWSSTKTKRKHSFQSTLHHLLKTKQDIEEKRLLALDRERLYLWRRHGEKVRLEQPVQRGWMRCYFLTEAARERSDAAVLEAILKEINVIKYHWRRSFAPTRRNRRAQILQFEQPLQRIKPWRRIRQDFPHEWKRYFFVEHVFQHRAWEHSWRFRWPQLFELRTVPRMVHELPVLDPAVDSRLSEIKAILANPRRSAKLSKLLGHWRWPTGRDRQKMLDRLAHQRIRATLFGGVEADKTACIVRAAFCASASCSIYLSTWNANRTSVPGLVANEIVPPSCGMGSMPSAFRHFSN